MFKGYNRLKHDVYAKYYFAFVKSIKIIKMFKLLL